VPWEELEDLLALGPNEFEEAVAAIFRELGFRRVRRTGGSGDLSVDITFCDKDNNLVAVQCKRYRPLNKVGSVEIQQFIGMAKLHHKADVGLYVTTSDYTRSAVQLAAQHSDLQLINGLMLAEMLGNVLGAPDKAVRDPRGVLKEAGLTAEALAEKTRRQLKEHGELKEVSEDECQCQATDISWAGHRAPDGRPVLVCPYCARIATPEEVHEAMIHGAISFTENVPGLEPLRQAARQRAQTNALAEEDVRFGLLLVRDSVIERKREQAARNALKQILGRKPTEHEVKALVMSPPPNPEDDHVCSGCSGKMPWSKRLDAYWCQACSHAEFPMADRIIRLMIPAT
jgi:Restriction endonuclease